MRSDLRNVLIFAVIAVLLLTPYYFVRSAGVEKRFINELSARSAAIRPAADSFNRAESPDPEKIKLVFNQISAGDRSFAAMALTDRFDGLKYLVKNDSILRSGAAVDDLIRDIKGRNLPATENFTPAIRTYGNGTGGSDRYYIITYASSGQKTYAIYAFRPDRKLVTRLGLEALLAISISFTLTGLVLGTLRKRGIGGEVRVKTIVLGAKKNSELNSTAKATRSSAEQIDQNDLTPIIGKDSYERSSDLLRKSRPVTDSISDSLNTVIFDLFKKIHRELDPESISLYIKKMEGRLSKAYELKEKTFLKIDSSLFDNIKVSEIENGGRGSTQIIEDGKVIRIPLFDDRSLLGLIEIRLRDYAEKLDIGDIVSGTKGIIKEIKEYLVINSVIVDRETGFFSKSYFNMKLSEQVFSAQKINTVFTLLLIDIFRDLDLDSDQKNTVLKIIYPVIKKSAGEVNELFLHDDKIAMLFTDKDIKDIENIELAVSKDISKFKIKLSADNIIRLKPVAAIMRSTDTSNVRNILDETAALFNSEE